MSGNDELSPCPFCGSKDIRVDNLIDPDDFFVHCMECWIQQIADYTREEAIRRWNKRAYTILPASGWMAMDWPEEQK